MISRRRVALALIVAGTALLVGALSLFAWTRWDEARAADSASAVMEGLRPQVGTVEAEGDDPLPRAYVDGNWYIGYLDVPALGLELPVMTTWSYDQLRVAPCRYFGSVETGNLVIAGYNYAAHFSRISDLRTGDAVSFVGMDGTAYDYEVADVEVLAATAVDEMTAGEYGLTLFTCTPGGESRVAVRCERA